MKLEAETIMRAKEGSVAEMRYLQEYFDDYINALSICYATDSDGHAVPFLNQDIKDDLRSCIIEATLKFDKNKRQKR